MLAIKTGTRVERCFEFMTPDRLPIKHIDHSDLAIIRGEHHAVLHCLQALNKGDIAAKLELPQSLDRLIGFDGGNLCWLGLRNSAS